jgi:protein O-GlcNAc transferase
VDIAAHEAVLDELFHRGDSRSVVRYAARLLREHNATGDATDPPILGSVYKFLGAGLHSLGRLEDATTAFALATRLQAGDLQNWMLLGDTLLHQFRAPEAAQVYEEAILDRRLTDDVSKLFKARAWVADWRGRDDLASLIRRQVHDNLRRGAAPGVSTAEFTDVEPAVLLQICRHQPNSAPAPPSAARLTPNQSLPVPVPVPRGGEGQGQGRARSRHRLGFVTSDLGVHPVSSLVRGLLTGLDPARFEVFCYSLSPADSWWRRNVTAAVEHVHRLHGRSHEDMARIIRDHGVHTLVDLNGHTMHSGLPVLALTPAPVQMSFLGSPMTTGAPFVDYFITDPLASPPWTAPHYSERLLLMPPSYIVNDHAQLMGHVVTRGRRPKPVEDKGTFTFATFSNFQKMDPGALSVWANILRRVPGSTLALMQYKLHDVALPNLRKEAASRGVHPDRLRGREQEPWIEHVWAKSDVDLALDTLHKNGHTTSLDALWGGVPVVTLAGERMESRAGLSLYGGLGWDAPVTYSAKEYEDLAVALAQDPRKMARFRHEVEARRATSHLFDTPAWTAAMQGAVDATLEVRAAAGGPMHVVSMGEGRKGPARGDGGGIAIHSALEDGQADEPEPEPERVALDSEEVVLVHVGGRERREDWVVVDVQQGPAVDVVAPMDDLKVTRCGRDAVWVQLYDPWMALVLCAGVQE